MSHRLIYVDSDWHVWSERVVHVCTKGELVALLKVPQLVGDDPWLLEHLAVSPVHCLGLHLREFLLRELSCGHCFRDFLRK